MMKLNSSYKESFVVISSDEEEPSEDDEDLELQGSSNSCLTNQNHVAENEKSDMPKNTNVNQDLRKCSTINQEKQQKDLNVDKEKRKNLNTNQKDSLLQNGNMSELHKNIGSNVSQVKKPSVQNEVIADNRHSSVNKNQDFKIPDKSHPAKIRITPESLKSTLKETFLLREKNGIKDYNPGKCLLISTNSENTLPKPPSAATNQSKTSLENIVSNLKAKHIEETTVFSHDNTSQPICKSALTKPPIGTSSPNKNIDVAKTSNTSKKKNLLNISRGERLFDPKKIHRLKQRLPVSLAEKGLMSSETSSIHISKDAPAVRQPNKTPVVRQPVEASKVRQPVETSAVRQPIKTPIVRQPTETPIVRQPTEKSTVIIIDDDEVDMTNSANRNTESNQTISNTSSPSLPKKSNKQLIIRSLEKKLRRMENQINHLYTVELTLDDMEKDESAYLIQAQLKERFLRTWHKYCKLTGDNPDEQLETRRVIRVRVSPHPEINRAVEKFVNRADIFPNLFEIKRICSDTNNKFNLNINSSELEYWARELFSEVGKKIKKNRKKVFREHFGSVVTDEVKFEKDPALKNENLKRRLKENERIAKQRSDAVFSEFERRQIEQENTSTLPNSGSCNSSDNEEDILRARKFNDATNNMKSTKRRISDTVHDIVPVIKKKKIVEEDSDAGSESDDDNSILNSRSKVDVTNLDFEARVLVTPLNPDLYCTNISKQSTTDGNSLFDDVRTQKSPTGTNLPVMTQANSSTVDFSKMHSNNTISSNVCSKATLGNTSSPVVTPSASPLSTKGTPSANAISTRGTPSTNALSTRGTPSTNALSTRGAPSTNTLSTNSLPRAVSRTLTSVTSSITSDMSTIINPLTYSTVSKTSACSRNTCTKTLSTYGTSFKTHSPSTLMPSSFNLTKKIIPSQVTSSTSATSPKTTLPAKETPLNIHNATENFKIIASTAGASNASFVNDAQRKYHPEPMNTDFNTSVNNLSQGRLYSSDKHRTLSTENCPSELFRKNNSIINKQNSCSSETITTANFNEKITRLILGDKGTKSDSFDSSTYKSPLDLLRRKPVASKLVKNKATVDVITIDSDED